jgi:hypothetical protein
MVVGPALHSHRLSWQTTPASRWLSPTYTNDFTFEIEMELVSPCVLPCQNGNCVNKTDKVEKTGMTTEKYRGNVISITAALKSAGQVSAAKVKKAGFNYPMLECS